MIENTHLHQCILIQNNLQIRVYHWGENIFNITNNSSFGIFDCHNHTKNTLNSFNK